MRIVDEKGADVGVDVPGELLVRASRRRSAPRLLLGYLKDAPATEEAWADGWFHTGDVVRRSADGDFHFVDRRKNVDPAQRREHLGGRGRERRSTEHPAVAASARRGDARPGARRRGARLHRPAQGAEPAAAASGSRPASSRHALERLAYFKAPGYVAFVDALPLTVVAEDPARRAARAGAHACPASRTASTRATMKRRRKAASDARTPGARSYEGVAVAVPVTVPYVRYSTHGAHWFIGQAIDALVERSGIAKDADRRPDRQQLLARARHRRRRDPAPGPQRRAGSTTSRPAARRA